MRIPTKVEIRRRIGRIHMKELSRSLGNARATLMLRKIVRFGTVAVLVLSAFGATSVFAQKIDVSQSTIVCNTVVGTASIKPPLSNTGASPTVQLTLKGTVDGCTVTSGNSAIILPSSFSAKLVGAGGNNCGALLGTTGLAGNVVFKWKTDKTTPILQTSSTVAVNSLTGGIFAATAADPNFKGSYGSFDIGVTGVGGAFAGTDVGATSSIFAATGQDISAILAACAGAKGLKTVNFSVGTITLH